MRRTLSSLFVGGLASVVVVLLVAFAAACSNAPSAPRSFKAPAAAHDQAGDPCTDGAGRSGYLIASGDKLVCDTGGKGGNLVPVVGAPSLSKSVPLPNPHKPVDSLVASPYLCGSCTTPDGRSGYTLSLGRCEAC